MFWITFFISLVTQLFLPFLKLKYMRQIVLLENQFLQIVERTFQFLIAQIYANSWNITSVSLLFFAYSHVTIFDLY